MKTVRPFACLAVFLLAACGADPAPGPTEQIIVREPGKPPVAVTPVASESDPAAGLIAEGKAAFANCVACHALAKDAANGVGPNLFGIVGNPAGAVSGFSYSHALKSSGIVWTAAELDGFLADPTAKIPGTTMVAGAMADKAKRQAVIAYIESVSAN